jgi:hypothetical protein
MNFKKAPPGFSGHTHGIAADLKTTDNGREFTVNSNVEHQRGWQKTWLYKWLVANAWKVFAGQATVAGRPVHKSQ